MSANRILVVQTIGDEEAPIVGKRRAARFVTVDQAESRSAGFSRAVRERDARSEEALGWPARAGKVVLTIALDRVADYYRVR